MEHPHDSPSALAARATAPDKVAVLPGQMSPGATRNLTAREWRIAETFVTAPER